MNVPPYIPEPIEIPGNVSEEHRTICLRFVRRTTIFHFLSILAIFGFAWIPLVRISWQYSVFSVVGLLIVLSAVRGVEKGRPYDLWVSVTILPVLLFSLGLMMRELYMLGWPVWSLAIGITYSLAYTMLSGRDHSFVGQYVIALIASSITIGFVSRQIDESTPHMLEAILTNGAFLFYYVYDSAAVLTRRRRGEEWAAVVDLYRDFLNGLTYSGRVWLHWKKYNIWSWPK